MVWSLSVSTIRRRKKKLSTIILNFYKSFYLTNYRLLGNAMNNAWCVRCDKSSRTVRRADNTFTSFALTNTYYLLPVCKCTFHSWVTFNFVFKASSTFPYESFRNLENESERWSILFYFYFVLNTKEMLL